MADITMCCNADCSKRRDCYRFTAKVGIRQAYFLPSPKEENCEYYWNKGNK